MAAFVRLELEMDDETQAILLPKLVNSGVRSKRRDVQEILNLFSAVTSGRKRGIFRAQVGSAYASQTVTCDQSAAVDGTDDITIGPTTISVEASPSGEDQMDSGSTDIEFAANLATAINDHSVLGEMFSAVSDGVDTVTITARVGGAIGNEVALAETGNGFTLGAAALASGANSTMREMDFGHS